MDSISGQPNVQQARRKRITVISAVLSCCVIGAAIGIAVLLRRAGVEASVSRAAQRGEALDEYQRGMEEAIRKQGFVVTELGKYKIRRLGRCPADMPEDQCLALPVPEEV